MKRLFLLGLLFLALPSWAANVTRVQSQVFSVDLSGQSSPFTCTLSGVTQGDLLLVTFGASSRTFSLADSNGSVTMIQDNTWLGGTSRTQSYYENNAAAGTHTFTWNAIGTADFPTMYCLEYAGQDPAAPIDGYAFGSGNSAALASGVIHSTIPNDVLFSVAGVEGGVLTPVAPLGAEITPAADTTGRIADTTSTPYPAGSSANAQWTASGSANWFSLGILIAPPRQPTGSILIQ